MYTYLKLSENYVTILSLEKEERGGEEGREGKGKGEKEKGGRREFFKMISSSELLKF